MKSKTPLKFSIVELSSIVEQIDYTKPLALDLETDGFYGPIMLAQFYQNHWSEVLLVARPDPLILYECIRYATVVAHNVAYELGTLGRQISNDFDKPFRLDVPNIEDTLFTSRLHWPDKQEYTLDKCYTYMLGHDVYEVYGLDKAKMQKSRWTGKLTTEQYLYAALDVYYLIDLYETTKTESISYTLERIATGIITKMQTYGLPVNMDAVKEHKRSNNEQLARMAVPINVNSYRQVRPYVGTEESDKLALVTLALQGNERAQEVLEARSLIKQNSYLTAYESSNMDGRLRGCFNFTAVSGRGRCSEINLQQLPRAFSYLFQAEPGKVFVHSDYSQLELRMACAYTNEKRMAELFFSGEDLHTFTAERLGSDRQVGKTCNFNLIYGGSARMLQSILLLAGVELELEDVQKLKRGWHSLWPSLTRWQEEQASRHRKGSLVSTLLGRRMQPKLYTDAMNLPIQGSSAEVAKLALHYQHKEFIAEGLLDKIEFCNFVHDQFVWTCEDDPALYSKVAEIVGNSMQAAWFEIIKHAKITDLPMPIEVEVGKNFKDTLYTFEV